MSFIKEFKEFAMRGNVIDLAVGVVIGGAFGKIVNALVEKIIVPLTGFLNTGQKCSRSIVHHSTTRSSGEPGNKACCHWLWGIFASDLRLCYRFFRDFSHGKADELAQEETRGCTGRSSPNSRRCIVAERDSRFVDKGLASKS